MKGILARVYYWLRNLAVHQANKYSKRPIGYERIYQVHIRKTAGTSVNAAFWAQAGYSFQTVGTKNVLYGNQLIMVRNNHQLIEKGDFFYGNSHSPFWKLNLPPGTYSFCILREPFERLFSLYKYYHWILELSPESAELHEPYYHSLIVDAQVAKHGFDKFMELSKKSDLINQLYQFSESFNVQEAIENCGKLNAIFFQDDFERLSRELQSVSQLALAFKKERKSAPKANLTLTAEQKQRAYDLLADEYTFYNIIREKYHS